MYICIYVIYIYIYNSFIYIYVNPFRAQVYAIPIHGPYGRAYVSWHQQGALHQDPAMQDLKYIPQNHTHDSSYSCDHTIDCQNALYIIHRHIGYRKRIFLVVAGSPHAWLLWSLVLTDNDGSAHQKLQGAAVRSMAVGNTPQACASLWSMSQVVLA